MASSKAFLFLFVLLFVLAYLISSEASPSAHETGEPLDINCFGWVTLYIDMHMIWTDHFVLVLQRQAQKGRVL